MKFQKKERMRKKTNDLEIGKDENCENMENVRDVVRRCRRLGNKERLNVEKETMRQILST